MAKAFHPDQQDVSVAVDELRRHESEARERVRAALKQEAAQQETRGRFPFAAGWYREPDIRRLRREAWWGWLSARVEGAILVGVILFAALVIHALLLALVPR